MKVREVIDMLSYGERFVLIGASTGKQLHKSNVNKKEHLEKFLDKECGNNPIRAIFDTRVCKITKQVDFMYPMISIWVNGM